MQGNKDVLEQLCEHILSIMEIIVLRRQEISVHDEIARFDDMIDDFRRYEDWIYPENCKDSNLIV